MNNFTFYNPTKLIVGKGAEKEVGTYASKLGKKALVVHYGNEIPSLLEVVDNVKDSLKKSGMEIVDFQGVKPNPLDVDVYRGIDICKKEEVDIVIAVGGGSVIDTAKSIALGVCYDGDFWDFFAGKAEAEKRLPVGVILTLPATGSESSWAALITKEEGHLKRSYCTDVLRPDFAIMNPEITLTLPKYQTACGIIDMITHILEPYLSSKEGNNLSDCLSAGAMESIVHNAKIIMEDPTNYDARANIMWSATIANNGSLGFGFPADWSNHMMAHELSGMYNTAHGATLSVMTPAYMRHEYRKNIAKYASFAKDVFGVALDEADEEKAAIAGIKALEEFLEYMGLPTSLQEIGAKYEDIDELVAKCDLGNEKLAGAEVFTKQSAKEVYLLAWK